MYIEGMIQELAWEVEIEKDDNWSHWRLRSKRHFQRCYFVDVIVFCQRALPCCHLPSRYLFVITLLARQSSDLAAPLYLKCQLILLHVVQIDVLFFCYLRLILILAVGDVEIFEAMPMTTWRGEEAERVSIAAKQTC